MWSGRPPEEAAAVLDVLMAHAPIGVAYLDRNLRYVAVNDVMATINGVPAAEHLGRTPRDVVPDVSARLQQLVAERVLGEGRSVEGVTVRGETAAAPGHQREWLVSFHPVAGPAEPGEAGEPDETDEPAGAGGAEGPRPALVVLAVEVSARREAEEQHRRLQAYLAVERARLDAVVQELRVGIVVV